MTAQIVRLYPRAPLAEHPPLRSIEEVVRGKIEAGQMTFAGAVLALMAYQGLAWAGAFEAVARMMREAE